MNFRAIKQSSFVRSVAVLASGVVIAQLLPILVSPLLTRMYTPEDFGVYAIFLAVISSVVPALCGKFEVAQLLPKRDSHSQIIFNLAIITCVIVSTFMLTFTFVVPEQVKQNLRLDELGSLLYLLPVALLFNGLVIATNYFANRTDNYALISKGKVLQSVILVSVQLILGVFAFKAAGLVLGTVFGFAISLIFLVYFVKSDVKVRLLSFGSKERVLLKRYREYPIYNASTGLLDGITQALPIFFVAYYLSDAIVGYLALVLRIANAPLYFLSSSISQVNLKKIVDLVNSKKPVTNYLIRVTLVLFGIVVIPTAVLMLWSPEIFAFVFGNNWKEAGVYAQILMPALALKFIVSTLSSTLGATNNSKLGALWKIVAFIVTVITLYSLAGIKDPILLFKALVIMDLCLYAFYYFLIYIAAKKPRNRH